MMKLHDLMRPMQAQSLRNFALLVIASLGARLEATSYQGISTTNPGAALYLTNQQAITVGGTTDSFTGFVSFTGTTTMLHPGTFALATVGRFGGTLNFNSKNPTVLLSDDLICNSTFRTRTNGHMSGGGYTLVLTGSLGLSNTNNFFFDSNIVIDGQGNTVTLSGTGAMTFNNSLTVSVTLRNMTLVLADSAGKPLTLRSSQNWLTLDNVKVIMSPTGSSYSFYNDSVDAASGLGRLYIENDVIFSGPGATFMQNAIQPLTICPGATLTFDAGTTLKYYTGNTSLLHMGDQTSTLRLDNCTLSILSASVGGITVPGLQLLGGVLEFDNQVFIENGGQAAVTNGLILGDGLSTANNVAINVLSGANVIVDGSMYYNQA